MSHAGRMFNQTLYSTETFSHGEDTQLLQEFLATIETARQLEAQHASTAPHLSSDNVSLRMIGKTGKQDPFNLGLFEEIFADGFRILTMSLHSNRESLDSPKDKVAVERPWDRSNRVLEEAERFMDLRVVRNRSASYEVAVSTKVFRGAMHYNLRSVARRLLEVRTHEGVVDNEERVRLPGNLADARDVDYAHQRVGRCLYPDEWRIFADGVSDVT